MLCNTTYFCSKGTNISCFLQDIKSLLQGRTFDLNYNCIYDGQLDAIAVWFELHLDDEITISTAPNASESCCWDQAIFYTFPQNLKGKLLCFKSMHYIICSIF